MLRWLQDMEERMCQSQENRLEDLRGRLEMLAAKRVMTDHLAYVQDKRMDLLHLQQRLGDLADSTVNRKRSQFGALAAALDAMSPLKVLGRGYAVAQKADGTILKSGRDVQTGERVHVKLGEGGFACTVDETVEGTT